MINWNGSKEEYAAASRIARRAIRTLKTELDFNQLEMDIMACHLNGCPLDLAAMEVCRDEDFAHDVLGIRKHLDRDTGELKDCFDPRCSLASTEA